MVAYPMLPAGPVTVTLTGAFISVMSLVFRRL
jgi:hypothetical protein